MQKFLIIILLAFTPYVFCFKDTDWLKQTNKRIEEEDINWLKQVLKETKIDLSQISKYQEKATKALNTEKKCHTCLQGDVQVLEEPKLYVFMSFSISENIWLSLSKKMEKLGGVFVLKGLPDNSFKYLADHILKLKEQGLNANIIINPKLFQEYNIQQVPSFVVIEAEKFDKITGNITLEYALEILSQKGETNTSKLLQTKLKEGH